MSGYLRAAAACALLALVGCNEATLAKRGDYPSREECLQATRPTFGCGAPASGP